LENFFRTPWEIFHFKVFIYISYYYEKAKTKKTGFV